MIDQNGTIVDPNLQTRGTRLDDNGGKFVPVQLGDRTNPLDLRTKELPFF